MLREDREHRRAVPDRGVCFFGEWQRARPEDAEDCYAGLELCYDDEPRLCDLALLLKQPESGAGAACCLDCYVRDAGVDVGARGPAEEEAGELGD